MLNGVVEDWWGTMGLPWKTLFGERRIGLPTVRFEARLPRAGAARRRSALHTRVKRIGNKSVDLEHTVHRGTTLLWQAAQVLVATSLDTHQSMAWPDDLRAALVSFQETPHAHHPSA